MPEQTSTSPDANILGRTNIVHQRSEGKTTAGLAEVTAAEARARAELSTRLGATVSGGTIQRHP